MMTIGIITLTPNIMYIIILLMALTVGYGVWITYFRREEKPLDQNENGLPFKTSLRYGRYYHIGFWDEVHGKTHWLLGHTTEGWSDYLKEGKPSWHRVHIRDRDITLIANRFKTIQEVKDYNEEIKLQQAKRLVDFWMRHDAAKLKQDGTY